MRHVACVFSSLEVIVVMVSYGPASIVQFVKSQGYCCFFARIHFDESILHCDISQNSTFCRHHLQLCCELGRLSRSILSCLYTVIDISEEFYEPFDSLASISLKILLLHDEP